MFHPLVPLFRLIYWIIGWKAKLKYPRDLQKSVIVTAPHTSNWDFIILVMSRYLLGMPYAKFLAKKELFKHPLGFIFYWLGGTPVDRSQRTSLVDQVAEKFDAHERFAVAITPEGTRGLTREWKSGFYHIAVKANVPLTMGFIDFARREVGIAATFYPTGNYEEDLPKIQAYFHDKRPYAPKLSGMPYPPASKRARWLNRIYSVMRFALVASLIYLLFQLPSLIYGAQQAYGQAKVLWNAQPIETFLQDPAFPDSLKAKIHLIQEVKAFTVEELGLRPSGSYTSLYDQQGEPILWVLTACEPFQLKAKTWRYPVLGTFSYKGFFSKPRAERTRNRYKAEGLDTRLGVVNAWSTLGILNDPILSNFLYKEEGDLVNLIIHELTHGTIFIKDNLTYNENLADFVGDEGTRLFFEKKYGSNSVAYRRYVQQNEDRKVFSQYVLQAAQQLDALYQSFPADLPTATKQARKDSLIAQLSRLPDSLSFHSHVYRTYFDNYRPNNAFFIAYRNYRERQNEFRERCQSEFAGNLAAFVAHMRTEYPSIF